MKSQSEKDLLSPLGPKELIKQLALVNAELVKRKKTRKINEFYPDEGPLRRELYRPHIEFFKAGARCRERAIIAANRIGKSEGIGGYETALHLTGEYPGWWIGKRFDRPISAWACGSTGQTVRDIVQFKLLGKPGELGTGMIKGDLIHDIKKKAGGVPDAIESCRIKHVSGGYSYLVFKSYDQKRKAFEGTEQDVIWLDEEAPSDIYGECLIRTMTTGGVIMLTFTPLQGLTEVVLNFMKDGKMPKGKRGMPEDLIGGYKGSKFIINATWDDAPHLTPEDKKEIWEATLPHLRDARAKGIPQLGAGAIYPILEEDIVIDDFEIAPWFAKCYGMDVGWNNTAVAWGAWNREDDVVYIYSVYKQGMREPASHVQAIHARGTWIGGVIDPSSIGKGQLDGKKLLQEYQDLGLNIGPANNAVEAGIFAVWSRLVTGRLKIFKSCIPLLNEIRLYRRDENGKVADKQDDHLMDALRYLIMSGLDVAEAAPYDEELEYLDEQEANQTRSKRAGYFGVY
jgi:phage terminase large subunit-like protein